MEDEALVILEMGRTSPAFRSTFGTNVGIGSQGLVMAGTPEQKAEWLPKVASGEIVTSFEFDGVRQGAGTSSNPFLKDLKGLLAIVRGRQSSPSSPQKA